MSKYYNYNEFRHYYDMWKNDCKNELYAMKYTVEEVETFDIRSYLKVGGELTVTGTGLSSVNGDFLIAGNLTVEKNMRIYS